MVGVSCTDIDCICMGCLYVNNEDSSQSVYKIVHLYMMAVVY